MPKDRASAIVLLVAVGVLGFDTAPVLADRNHGLTHTSAAEMISMTSLNLSFHEISLNRLPCL
jgi:hypothetical protein